MDAKDFLNEEVAGLPSSQQSVLYHAAKRVAPISGENVVVIP